MNLILDKSWENIFEAEFSKPYFKELMDFVDHEYQHHTCYPEKKAIFSAFNYCAMHDLKVVIIGQDPYHGAGQANGLCFSVPRGIKCPPSLVNIYKELTTDLNLPYPATGDLSSWAKQGVLLLNATLSVRAHEAGSHQKKGWETFTDCVIKKIVAECPTVVFLLWGGYAKKKIRLIDTARHKVLTAGHPSPLSANRGYWFGNKHFSKANSYLISKGLSSIDW